MQQEAQQFVSDRQPKSVREVAAGECEFLLVIQVYSNTRNETQYRETNMELYQRYTTVNVGTPQWFMMSFTKHYKGWTLCYPY